MAGTGVIDVKKYIFLTLPAILIIVILVYVWNIRSNLVSTRLPLIKPLPTFNLRDVKGNSFTLSDMKGKITVVDFIFTRCLGPCPVMTGHMKRLYDKYSDRSDIRFISISVDPEFDTADVLKEYSRKYGVIDDRWVFLRGEMDSIVKLSEDGFLLAASDLPFGHSLRWVLVDKDATIRGYYEGTDPTGISRLEEDLTFLAGR